MKSAKYVWRKFSIKNEDINLGSKVHGVLAYNKVKARALERGNYIKREKRRNEWSQKEENVKGNEKKLDREEEIEREIYVIISYSLLLF